MDTSLIILIAIVFIVAFYLISLYNRMVRLRNNRENAFADIDVQLKQRHDLIPQLLSTVKGFMKHEEKVLIDVTEARTAAMNANSIDDKIAAERILTQALGGLKVAVEAYPDLKSNTNFLQFQEEISDIENKLAASRRFFNSATKEFNNSIETFPANMISGAFGFHRASMFDLGETERDKLDDAPNISFE